MKKMAKTTGIFCLLVCGLCILYLMSSFYLSPSVAGSKMHHFYGVSAQEGTMITVANGELCLVGNGGLLSIDAPLKHVMSSSLLWLCFLMTLISGIVLLKVGSDRIPSSKKSQIAEQEELLGSE